MKILTVIAASPARTKRQKENAKSTIADILHRRAGASLERRDWNRVPGYKWATGQKVTLSATRNKGTLKTSETCAT